MEKYLFDGIAILICLWFVKSYFLHIKMTEEEALIVREAPKWLLYPLTFLLCLSLLTTVSVDFGLIPVSEKDAFRFVIVSFLLWSALAMYTKWNWGVHVEDRDIRNKNKKQLLLMLLLMGFLLTML